MAGDDASEFLGACLYAFAEGASDEHRRVLAATAPRLGLSGGDPATRLFVGACQAMLDEPLPEDLPQLTHPQQCAFLVWLSGILFDRDASAQAKLLHELGIHYMTAGAHPLFARHALRRALAVRLHSDEAWSPTIDSLTQLAVAFDETGRPDRAARLLDLACRLSDVHAVEPRCRDACLRLSAADCAWRGDLGTAIHRLDAADPLSAAAYGASPLSVDIAWTLAICRQAFHADGTRGTLMSIMSQALADLGDGLEPSARFTDVDGLQHGLARTLHAHLALLSNRLAVRLASELPELSLSTEDRCILFNNYGNALLHAGCNTLAIAQFIEAARIADRDGDGGPDEQADADYQRMHALGGVGFAQFNLAKQERTPAGRLAALQRAAAAFDAAGEVRRRVGSRAWFDGRIWACAGLTHADLGQTETAWRDFARALVAGASHWSMGADAADLGAFFNPDSDIREKLTAGLEHLQANHAAVLFGKAAVHAVHQESLPDVDGPLSLQYVQARSGVHRTLARCLTAVGRHNEAEQAFALLKDDAWGLYVRRTGVPIEVESAVALTRAEASGVERSGLPGIMAGLAGNADPDEAAVDALAATLARLDGTIGAEGAAREHRRKDLASQSDPAAVAPGDARVRYVVSPERMSIAVEAGDGVAVQQVDVSFGELSVLAFALRQAGRQPGSGTWDDAIDAAQRLEALLIAPVRALLQGVDHLWIEVDSPLEGVPFAALFDGSRHLFEDFSIAYLNVAGRSREAGAVPGGDASITVFPCSEVTGARLPGAAAEAAAIEAAALRAGGGVRVESFRHEQCTAARLVDHLKRQGQRRSAIHLATHAEFNATSDALSVLALADSNLSIRRLRRELEAMGADVGVFVLSACGTARQDLDVEGFSATLLRAGVGAVVSSLWETLDAGAPAFFAAFYSACNDFSSPRQLARALRHAQRELHGGRSDEAGMTLRHPAHWAPYVVTSSRMA